MITIEKLSLHNFMSVSDADLVFQKQGITMFVGENGYGKSAVADAITLCFLESKRSDSFKDYVKQGTSECTIHLEGTFQNEPIIFDVSISSPDGKMKKKLTYKGESFATNSEVSKKLEELDIQYFADILFTSQKADDITSLTPLKRAEYMKRLLAVSFEEELKQIEIDTDIDKDSFVKKTSEREQKQQAFDSKDSEFQSLLPMPDPTVIQALSAEITSISKDIDTLTEQVSANSETLTTISEMKDLMSKYDEGVGKINVSVNGKKDELRTIDFNIKETEAQLADASLLDTKCIALKKELEDLVAKERPLEEDRTAKKDIMQAKADAEQALLSVRNEKNRIYEEKKNAESTGICPTCKRPYENFDLEKAKQETIDAKGALDVAEENYQKAKVESSQAKEDFTEADKVAAGISVIKTVKTNEYTKLFDEYSKCPMEEMVKAEVDILEEKKIQTQVTIESLEKDISNLLAAKAEVAKKVEELSNSVVQVDNTLLRQKSILRMTKQSELDELNKISATNAQIEIQNKRVTESKKELGEEIKALDLAITEVTNHMNTLKEARQMLEKDLPNFLIVRTCAKLQETINQLLQATFPYLEVYLFQSKKGVEFFYTTNAELSNPEDKETLINAKMLSGCQKDYITVAFKLALAKAYKLPFAFFDEIDSAATEHNSETLYTSILNSGILKQVFLVTHKPETRNVIANLECDITCYKLPEKGVFQLTEDLGDVN